MLKRQAGWLLIFTLFLAFFNNFVVFAKKKKDSEKELFKKSHELSYEGQVEKARSLLEGPEGDEEKKQAKKEDDGFSSLFLSMIWGAVGTGFFIFGKKQSRAVFLLCGILLCVFPFFVPDALASTIIGLILCVAPFKIG